MTDHIDIAGLRKLLAAANHWATEMERAVEAVTEAAAHVEIIDGNRAVASTLRESAVALSQSLAVVEAALNAPRCVCRASCPHRSNPRWACQCGGAALREALAPFRAVKAKK